MDMLLVVSAEELQTLLNVFVHDVILQVNIDKTCLCSFRKGRR